MVFSQRRGKTYRRRSKPCPCLLHRSRQSVLLCGEHWRLQFAESTASVACAIMLATMTQLSRAALYMAGAAVCLTALFFTIYLVYFHTIRSPTHLAWRPYSFSELLINYNAGLLRRGLIGAVIHHYAGSKPAL